MEEVFCPKDQATMQRIERNGITIERCPECGGIFLDRGELERLIEAEAAYMRGAAPAYENRPADYDYRRAYDDDYGHHGHHGGHHGDHYGHHGGHRRHRGFFGDLFDFD